MRSESTATRPARLTAGGTSLVIICGFALLLLSCGGDKTGPESRQEVGLIFVTQPSPQVSSLGEMVPGNSAVEVMIVDASGNTVTESTRDIAIAITGGTGTVGATLANGQRRSAFGGVARFAGLTIDKAGAGYTLTATAPGTSLPAATSTSFTVVPGAPAKMAFTGQPANAASMTAMSPAVEVTVQDFAGNVATSSTASITLALASGGGPSGAVLGGTLVRNVVNGVATFSNLTVDKAGAGFSLTASSGAFSGATSSAFTVSAGAPSKLAFTVQPANVASGVAIGPAVQVAMQDASGNPVSTATNAITLSITTGTGASGAALDGTVTQSAVNGVATFNNLTVDKASAGYTLTAAGASLASAASNAFAVTAGVATKLGFAVQPSNVASGASINPAMQVVVQDANGNTVTSASNNITVAITAGSGTSDAALTGTATRSAVGGTSGFNDLKVDRVGTGYTFTATAAGLTSGVSSGFAVTPGAAAKLAFSAQPTNAGAGATISPSVQVLVQDAGGNTVTTATNDVVLSITPGTGASAATLGGTLTQAAVSGVATFNNLTINKVGTGYSLAAKSAPTAPDLTTGTSAAFAITAGPAAKVAFGVQPVNSASGATISPAIQVLVQDAGGNTVAAATDAVTIAITGGSGAGGALLGGTLTRNAVNGVAMFTDVNIDKASSGYTLTATATSLTAGASATFAITAGVRAKLGFAVQPMNAGSGAAISPAVQVLVQDANGNTVTNASDYVTLTITPGTGTTGASLSGVVTTYAVNGVVTFSSLSVDKAGAGYTLTATAGTMTGTSSAFEVAAGAATKLAVITQPTNATAGAEIAPAMQVEVQDANGNRVTASAASITISIGNNPGASTLSGTATVAAVSGAAVFNNLTLNKAGTNYSLIAASSGLTSATSTAFNVLVGAPVALAFTTQPPASQNVGATLGPLQVSVRDANGNVVTTATSSIAVALLSNSAGAILGGTSTVNAVSGVATFSNLTLDKPGQGFTLEATATSLTSVTSTAFNAIGPVTQLAFTTQPTSAVRNASLSPSVVVAAKDAAGNVVNTGGQAITIAIGTNAGGGSLGGTVTRSLSAGTATFNDLSVNAAGTGYTLTASGASATGATSSAFDIAEFGAAAKIGFVAQPTNATIGATISPAVQVAIQDAFGNTVTNSSASITLAFATNPGSATLGGTLTASAVSGVASFGDLTVSVAGANYTLAGSSSSLTPATSTSFNVVDPNAAIKLGFIQQPTSTTAGSTLVPALTVAIQNGSGATVTSDNSTVVSITVASGPPGGTVKGTLSATAVNGIATFSSLSDTVSGVYTLRTSASGLTSGTSNSYTVAAGVAAKLAFIQQPTNARAGDLWAPVVRVAIQDAYGNTVPSASNSVTINRNSPCCAGDESQTLKENLRATQPGLGGATTVAAVSGIATFSDLRPRWTKILYYLQANATGFATINSTGFTISPSVPTQIWAKVPDHYVAFCPVASCYQADGQTANFGFQVSAFILDSLNNQVDAGSNIVHLDIGSNPSNGTLVTANNVGATNGKSTFNVVLDKGGNGYTFVASTTGLTSVPSFTFNVAAFGTASRLGFTGQPTNAALGAPISPAVTVCVQDGAGNTVTTATNNITIAIGTNPGSATLGGAVTANAVSGCATFSNLAVSADGSAYTLTASASGLTGATSTTFNVFTLNSVSAGNGHACGVAAGGAAYCWGSGSSGQLGNNTDERSLIPVAVSGGRAFAILSAGYDHSCGVTTGGSAFCWGDNGSGQLGNGSTTSSTVPVAVSGGLTFTALSSGYLHTCGLTTGGAVHCWGGNGSGQLGNSTNISSSTPVAVSGGLTFATVSTRYLHTCGVTTGGAAYCWGNNQIGALGNNSNSPSSSPVAVSGGLTLSSVSAGTYYSCALTTGGVAYCWGANPYGQHGNNTTTNSNTPVAVSGGLTFATLSVTNAGSHTCAVTTGGTAYCWGHNTFGELGNNSTNDAYFPVAVSGGLTFATVSPGGVHTCGRTNSGAVYCWGDNGNGGLGNGTTTASLTPVRISSP